MADGKKIYSIEINGIKESVTQVEALRRQLDELEKRVNTLKGQSVNVSSSSAIDTQALAEEAKLRKQIDALEAKSVTYNSEIYQSYLAQKEQLDKVLKDQKQIAASERLQANQYSNTITGLRDKLADLKRVMATTDLSDEMFGNIVKQANDLNNQLKEIEQSYGQFGRNVGNYKSAIQDLNNVVISVNGVERSFKSAREAYRTLKNERDSMALSGKRETEQFRELDNVVKTLQSDINDLSKSSVQMDFFLDTMQGFTALGSIGQGFAAIFGMDNQEIQKSIQKLLAFQAVLNGIEVIIKQWQTGEGLFGKTFKMIDAGIVSLTNKVTALRNNVINKTLQETTALRNQMLSGLTRGTAEYDAAMQQFLVRAGEIRRANAQQVANMNKLRKAYIACVPAIKVFMSALTIGVYAMVANWIMAIIEKINQLGQAAHRLNETLSNINASTEKQVSELKAYRNVVEQFNGSISQQNTLVENLNSKFGDTLGRYETLSDWLKVLKDREDEFTEAIRRNVAAQEWQRSYEDAVDRLNKAKTAKADWASNEGSFWGRRRNDLSKAWDTLTMSEGIFDFWNKAKEQAWGTDSGRYNRFIETEIENATRDVEKAKKMWEDAILDAEKFNQEHSLFGYAVDKTKKDAAEVKKTYGDIEKELYEARMKEMQDGFRKTVIELNKERQERIKRIREVGTQYKKEEAEINAIYDRLILKQRQEFNKEIEKTYKTLWDDINDETLEGQRKNLELLEQGLEEYTKQAEESLRKDVMTGLLSPDYSENINAVQQYYNKRTELEVRNIENLNLRTIALYKKEAKDEEDALVDKYNTMIFEAEKYYKERLQFIDDQERLGMLSAEEANQERLENEKRYQKAMTTQYANYEQQKHQIAEDLEAKITQTERDNLEKRREIVSREYDEMISIINNAYTDINNETRNLTVVDSFGIINLRKTKEQTERVKELFRNLRRNLIAEKARIEALFKDGLISPEDFERWIKEIDQKIKDIDLASDLDTADWQDWLKSIQVYVQAASQTINSILDAVGAQMDANYEKQLDELDRMNEAIEKKLDEQEDIIEKHRDAIDDIEDELATARGDRRQHLIDMLNAEIVAQREAQAERERLQKEQEAIEKRQEKIEADRRKSEKKIAIAQATISTAQAVTNALAVKPFTLGIILAAAAAVQGAAQIATIKATKYADGGVIQGPSHSQGGVKVLGGTAEVEGGEFLVDKRTTSANMDLLYYINGKRRKLNLLDFTDFYNGKVKPTIKHVQKKYENGGVLPTNTNVDVKEQLRSVVVNEDNRPVVVSVVDINNAQSRVRNVRVLAGLNDD